MVAGFASQIGEKPIPGSKSGGITITAPELMIRTAGWSNVDAKEVTEWVERQNWLTSGISRAASAARALPQAHRIVELSENRPPIRQAGRLFY
jgi:hypothetical protein